MSAFEKLVVANVQPLTAQACSVSFAVPDELREQFGFHPGQHLTLRTVSATGEERRTYSICSTATELTEDGRVRIGVKRIPDGTFSGWLTSRLRPGDTVEVMTPAGRFGTSTSPANARHVGCIAAGSGITPVLSIAASVLCEEPDSRVTLVYGNRTSNDVMFLEELADLKNTYPARFTLLHVLSAEPQLSDLLTGRIDAGKVATLRDSVCPDVDAWYLCGPFGMVSVARETLVAGGVAEAAIHAELFYVSEVNEEAPVDVLPSTSDQQLSQVTVTLAGRTSTVPVGYAGPSILDAVLANRPDAPYACKGGVCGTCRAKVTAGAVAMARNYALEPEEIDAGLVLACQSRPVTPEVSLEFA